VIKQASSVFPYWRKADIIIIPSASAFPYYCHSRESCDQHYISRSLSLVKTLHFQLLWGGFKLQRHQQLLAFFFMWVSFDCIDRYRERGENKAWGPFPIFNLYYWLPSLALSLR
jgi:hypothetical protein